MKLKDFVPPVIIRMAKKIFVKETIFFGSFEEAAERCDKGYNNEELCNMVGKKTLIYKNSLVKPYKVHPTYLLLNGAICKYCNDYKKDEITILDLGGSCGAVYFEMRGIIGNKIKLECSRSA
jgi:hypothetical protein